MPPASPRHPLLLDRDRAVLVVIDIQEKLAAAMPRRDEMVARARFVIQAANLLGVPVAATEQYRKGLGPTVPEIRDALGGAEAVEKMSFSCCGEEAARQAIARHPGRDQAILVGIEAHVCVYQTALDLMEMGRKPFVAADAVCSRNDRDAEVALQALTALGAVPATAESAVFQLLGGADAPEFKAVHKLLKG